jgi:uncharacterized protein (TIGR02466 family)
MATIHSGPGVAGRTQPPPSEPFALKAKQVWPTMLFTRIWDSFPEHREAIIEECYRIKASEKELIASRVAVTAKPAMGLFESKMDLFQVTQHPSLLALRTFLSWTVAEVVSGMNGREVPPDRIGVDLSDSWIHVTNNGGFHDAHYHGGCSWCGIFYIRAGDVPTEQPKHAANGINRFYSPIRVGACQGDYGNNYLSNTSIDIPPSDGKVVIFPAYLLHSALPYTGGVDRIVLAFNSTSRILPTA